MSAPAQVTEAHRTLSIAVWAAVKRDETPCGAQLIADSEARACAWALAKSFSEYPVRMTLKEQDDAREERAQLRADKIRLDALDAILAENAHRARLGWRWNPEGPDSEFKLHLSQDGKMRSIRQALDVMLAARKEGAK